MRLCVADPPYPPNYLATQHGAAPLRAFVSDVLTAAGPRSGFAGAKPPAWTRWVLDAMGYDPDADELVDMFPGSGAVDQAARQCVLPLERAQ